MGPKKRSTLRRQRKRAPAAKGRKPFWKRLVRATPVFLVAVAATFLLSRVGALQQLETKALDFQMRLQHSPTESGVALVRITDDDYRDIFQNKSPLDPAGLQKLIRAIAVGKPKVIGVDIDTSPSQFQNMELPEARPPIVWARTGVFSNKEGKFYLQDVLGGKEPPPPSGLITLKEDADGVVRRYQRVFAAKQGSDFPSFPWAVVKQLANEGVGNLRETEEELFINFAAGPKDSFRVGLPASHVLSLADSQGWQDESPIKDKIVLLAGDYAVQDEHKTPLGWMLGAEVLAHVIETELQGGGRRPASRAVIAALQIFDGLALLLLFHLYRLRTAVLLSLLSVPILAMLCSLLASRSLSQWAYFGPVLIAVLLQQLYERVKDYKKQMLVETYNIVTETTPDTSPTSIKSKR